MPRNSTPRNHEASAPRFERLGAVLESLAHPTRRTIVLTLAIRGPMAAGDLADRFKVSWPTVTRHLSLLEQSGVLRVSPAGRHRVYELVPGTLAVLSDWVTEVRRLCEDRPAALPWAALPYSAMPGNAEDDRPQRPRRHRVDRE